MLLTGKGNATIKRYAALKDAPARAATGLFLLEGERLIIDSIRAGAELDALFVREDEAERLTGVFSKEFPAFNCQLSIVNCQLFNKLCGTVTPQGVVAAVKIPAETPYCGGDALILDGVRDPGNLGTLIRSAAGFGFSDVYLLDCADPFSPKAVRSSMSAVFCARLHRSQMTNDKGQMANGGLFGELKSRGATIIAADMDGGDIKEYKRGGPAAVVVGGEAHGISSAVRAAADVVLGIKTTGIESLNAAVAGSILMFYLAKT